LAAREPIENVFEIISEKDWFFREIQTGYSVVSVEGEDGL